MKLPDKVIVVMGGTTGLGLAGARACANEGARVVVVGRNRENAEQAAAALGARAVGLCGDAAEEDTAARAVHEAVERFGRLDGLYHVAGGSGRRMGDGPLHEITGTGWAHTVDLNLTSVFYSNRAAVRQFMKQESGGTVLNMSSVLGFAPAPRHFATHAYAAAKAAIAGLTKSAAAYYAAQNIRFNAVAPGLVETPMSRRAQESEEVMEFIQSKQPLDGGRIGHATDLDAAAVYFLSDDSRFVTGQVLAVDGGWSVS